MPLAGDQPLVDQPAHRAGEPGRLESDGLGEVAHRGPLPRRLGDPAEHLEAGERQAVLPVQGGVDPPGDPVVRLDDAQPGLRRARPAADNPRTRGAPRGAGRRAHAAVRAGP